MKESDVAQTVPQPRRYRFGTRWLLVLMLVCAAVFGWFGRESHRVRRQTQLLSALAQSEVRVREQEPTALALVARKLLGPKDVWLTERIAPAWFWRPRILVTWTMTDKQVPDVTDRIKRLGVVQKLHLEQSPLSQQGISILKKELPDVSVLTSVDLVSVKPQLTEQSGAVRALRFMATLGMGILVVVIVLVWPFSAS